MKGLNFQRLRENMVSTQIIPRGINSQRVLKAFRAVPRHLFVPDDKRKFAYEDYPVSIGEGQTISQPFMVALMTELLDIKEEDKVLEVGTGSGYQAAILSFLGAKVFSIERIPLLAKKAENILISLGYKVKIKIGDGTKGWSDFSPYDRIIITAATPCIYPSWIKQLKVKGKLILPLGGSMQQDLTLVEKIDDDKIIQKKICECVFVPLIEEYEYTN